MMYKEYFKRPIDTLLALFGTVVLCIPMGFIAIAIKIDSKGSILFKQKRLGKKQKPFTVYKFRTMCDHAYELGGIATRSDDARITKVGAFLRRTSLDELPQFLNIIIGDMAIIGPRPIIDWEFADYQDNQEYKKRYGILPGMFCTVDLKYRAEADRNLQFKMDAEYSENISFFGDLKIFFGIIKSVLIGKKIYKEEVEGND